MPIIVILLLGVGINLAVFCPGKVYGCRPGISLPVALHRIQPQTRNHSTSRKFVPRLLAAARFHLLLGFDDVVLLLFFVLDLVSDVFSARQ